MWERVEKRGIDRRGLVPGPGERPRPDLAPGTDLLPAIKHIVVLMLENHSYDNYLGLLARRGDGLPVDACGAPAAVNVLPNGQRGGARGRCRRRSRSAATRPRPGTPATSRMPAAPAAGSPRRSGRPCPAGTRPSPWATWTEADLPFYHGLARTLPGG